MSKLSLALLTLLASTACSVQDYVQAQWQEKELQDIWKGKQTVCPELRDDDALERAVGETSVRLYITNVSFSENSYIYADVEPDSRFGAIRVSGLDINESVQRFREILRELVWREICFRQKGLPPPTAMAVIGED